MTSSNWPNNIGKNKKGHLNTYIIILHLIDKQLKVSIQNLNTIQNWKMEKII